ncbi:hypothetical protein J31TS4_40620 [Paenibacillus sp. J31TS4]|uniref:hypothetical protein n=1 Tax=Paenibacillus sp. J31TS4 TaxID=2807195 RepID=UPI001B09D29E|nr:hypothetical protein [Paenibacillus sp. J31TS4]GIP40782.1 hypothetical protein J31TS4_40620 [Paenibacillus sp. J31TS4]
MQRTGANSTQRPIVNVLDEIRLMDLVGKTSATAEKVKTALDQLPDKEKRIIYEQFLREGRKNKRTCCKALGMSERAFLTLRKQALDRLTEALKMEPLG